MCAQRCSFRQGAADVSTHAELVVDGHRCPTRHLRLRLLRLGLRLWLCLSCVSSLLRERCLALGAIKDLRVEVLVVQLHSHRLRVGL